MPRLEVFADVACPFAHVGLRVVCRERAARGGATMALRVRAWPLELVNGEPLDPGATAHHVRELRSQVAPDLFRAFDPSQFPSTSLPALALASRAYRRSDRVGEAVSLALRDALFEEGRDVSRPDVLAAVARAHGLRAATVEDAATGAEDVLADWREGRARGVLGSPHFFCGGRDAFCPSLAIGKDDDGALRVERRTDVLDDFLSTCFS
jgi:predicted DsbA family dithiol-disulfide isomerase